MASHIAAVFILALAFLAAGIDTYAATLVVTKTVDTADGICDSDCSLREAVSAAASGDTVVFSSLFNEPRVITLTLGQIAITKNLTITGSGRDFLTVSGNNASRILRITGGGTVSVSGMKLTNGVAAGIGDAVGGAIFQTSGLVSLSGVTISNNAARQANQPTFGAGGGVCVDGGTLLVMDSSISMNTVPASGNGAGIYLTESTVSINRSSVSYNVGTGIDSWGTVSLVDSTVIGNTGSALLNLTGSVTVIDSTISNNGGGIEGGDSVSELTIDRSVINDNDHGGVSNSGTARITNSFIKNNANDQFGGKGGGIWNTGTLHISSTAIIGNTAFEAGGGIYNVLGRVYLTNSTVSGNFAVNGAGNSPCPGGGIANLWTQMTPGGTVVLTNSTVAKNTAQGRGGGVCNQAGGTVTSRNSIVAQNIGTTSLDFSGTINSEGYNLIGDTSGSTGWGPNDLQNTNPLLAPLGNNGGNTWTHALLPGSPGIDSGNNALALDPIDNSLLFFDQRAKGFARVVSTTVDIGAYEANYAIGPVAIGGRVLINPGGRAISNARITLTDAFGNVRYSRTNPAGYYRFPNLTPGTSYTVRVSHKSYQFDSPQVVTIDQPRDNLDFVAIGH